MAGIAAGMDDEKRRASRRCRDVLREHGVCGKLHGLAPPFAFELTSHVRRI